MKNYNEIKKKIEENNGIIFAKDLDKFNMNRYALKELEENGDLKRIIHGVYAKPDKNINEFWVMSQRYKKGIYSHNTALYFYNLTDRTPIKLDMTFPSNIRVNNECLNIHYIKKESYLTGLTEIEIEDNTTIRIYDLERTICDIIRDRNKLDLQIFNNAMKQYSKLKNKNLNLLYKYAKQFKIENILKQYMEVLY